MHKKSQTLFREEIFLQKTHQKTTNQIYVIESAKKKLKKLKNFSF